MNVSSSVQFRDAENTLAAFQNRNVEVWSIWQNKQFMFKGKGISELTAILDLLINNAANCVYTLKVYEDLDTDKGLKNNTPDDGSFNFRLNDPAQGLTQTQFNQYNSSKANESLLLSKLSAIEERLNLLDEAEEKEPNKLGFIGDILEHPVLAPIVPVLIQKVLEIVVGKTEPAKLIPMKDPNQRYMGTSINGIPGVLEPAQDLTQTISKLQGYDPNLLEHLKKLLAIAEKDINTFNLIINALN
jgi:hypothetical protein